MIRLLGATLLFCALTFSPAVRAQHHSSGGHSHSSKSSSHASKSTTRSSKSKNKGGGPTHTHSYRKDHMALGYTPHPSVRRDSHGKIKRRRAVTEAFQRQHACPSTGRTTGPCPGYIKDHIRPLECGGADDSSNMQWQTTTAAKEKDKTERACRQ
jgi:hypothetical protein